MSTYDVSFEENNNISNSNGRIREEANVIINHSLPTFIGGYIKRQNLVMKSLVRLDLQGQFDNVNGIRYANLHIQLNATTASHGLTDRSVEEEANVADGGVGRHRPTTIAIVLMPCDEQIPKDIMKKAFNVSLIEGKKATIFKTR